MIWFDCLKVRHVHGTSLSWVNMITHGLLRQMLKFFIHPSASELFKWRLVQWQTLSPRYCGLFIIFWTPPYRIFPYMNKGVVIMFDTKLLSSGRILKKKDLRRRTSLFCVYLFLRLFSRTKTHLREGGSNVRTRVLDGRLGWPDMHAARGAPGVYRPKGLYKEHGTVD